MSTDPVHCALIGLSALCDLLRERNVIIWSDNRGAEFATAKGTHASRAIRVRIARSRCRMCRRHEAVRSELFGPCHLEISSDAGY